MQKLQMKTGFIICLKHIEAVLMGTHDLYSVNKKKNV